MAIPPVVPIGDLALPAMRRAVMVASDCGPQFIVMSLAEPDYEVAGIANDMAEVERVLERAGGDPSRFSIVRVDPRGQFYDPLDPSGHTCWSEQIPPIHPGPPPGGRPRVNIGDVRRIRVVFESEGGEFELEFPGYIDSIFMTRGARERFAYPYYQAAFGGAHLAAVRRRIGDS